MDVLSSVVEVTRAGRPRSFQVLCRAPWGRRYAPVPGAGFHIVLRGSCWLIPAAGKPAALGAGDVVLLPHGDGHALADSPATRLVELDESADESMPPKGVVVGPDRPAPEDAPSTVLVCGMYQFDRRWAHPLLAELPKVVHLPAGLDDLDQLPDVIGLLSRELESERLGRDSAVTALLDVLLLHVLRAWYGRAQTAAFGWGRALRDPAVRAALDAIHRDPERRWTVEKLAAHAGLSRAPFARRFAAGVGRPPLGYVTWWRMVLAAKLLRESDLPLRVLATRVGYATEFAFANAFSREFGTSPGRYRRQAAAAVG